MLICEKVDIAAREVNHRTRPVAYRAHIGDLYYVSVTMDMDVLTFDVFTFHAGLRASTCVLLAMDSVFASTSGHIY